ncbi:hypothetical protein ACFQ3Z_08580 [Streptomyces nogalater]
MSSFEFPGEYYEIMRRDFRPLAAETEFLASFVAPEGASSTSVAARGPTCGSWARAASPA